MTEALTQPFPPQFIEHKNGQSFVPHEIVRDRVIEATGNQFDWTIDQVLFRDDGVTRRATNRETGETPRPWTMIVIGTLTIPGLGSRAGIGAHPLDAGAGEDAAYKSAESDAFKRAAMAFGVGLRQLYIERSSSAPHRPNRSKAAAPKRPVEPAPISLEAFVSQVQQAVSEQDGAAYRRLAETAGQNIDRWQVLIEATVSGPALDWIERKLERIHLESDVLRDLLTAKRTSLQAA